MPVDETLTIALFFESWELFREPALAGTLMGGVLGFMGVYVVMRRMVFLSAALSQTAGLGVALSFYAKLHLGLSGLWVSPTLGALTLSIAAIAAIMSDRSESGTQRDGILGLIFLLGSAGTLAVGTRIVQEIQDIQTLLFGTAVAVLPEDFQVVVYSSIGVVALHLWWSRGFLAVSLDADDATVRGMRSRLIDAVLLVSIALGISVTTRILGALPAFTFSVLPAMAAIRLTPNIPRAMMFAGVLGAGIGFIGYLVAFLFSLPVGASQALVAGIIVIIAYMLPSR